MPHPTTAGRHPLFSLAIFLGAFLLFLVQPLVGKALLPWFGGAPAVWATCMLFFQSALLLGYALAHGLFARLSPAAQRRAYLGLLAAGALLLAGLATAWPSPVTPGAAWAPEPGQWPVGRLLLLLAISCGLPYLALSAASPLLQSWFASAHPDRTPYRLYALSNTGSLLALLIFPFVFEPLLTVSGSGWLWSAGFLLFLGAAVGCARVPVVAPPPDTAPDHTDDEGSPVWWFSLACGGSLLLLATTNHLTEEIAVTPLLWIGPLALYLGSMILAFAGGLYRRSHWLVQAALAAALLAWLLDHYSEYRSAAPQLAVYLYVMTVGCVLCHGELARLKPAPARLTSFYLWMSAGGAAGGLLVGLGAPTLLPAAWELHLTLALVAPLIVAVVCTDPDSRLSTGHPVFAPLATAGLVLLAGWELRDSLGVWIASRLGDRAIVYVGLLMVGSLLAAAAAITIFPPRPVYGVVVCALAVVPMGRALVTDARNQIRARHVSRNFYGVLRIIERDYPPFDTPSPGSGSGSALPPAPRRVLIHGKIKHGLQLRDHPGLATAYYAADSGLGRAIAVHPRTRAGQPLHVGAIGLGVGTIAALVRRGDAVTFYEINEQVIRLAEDASHFTFLSDARAAGKTVDVVAGDARLSLARESRRHFDVLAIDAFTGGAVPAHLLTREAVALYLSHLRDDRGVLAFHISNNYLDLTPVLLGAAKHHGLTVRMLETRPEDHERRWINLSDWLLLARDPAALEHPRLRGEIEEALDMSTAREWTDDFSNLLGLIRW